jgi:hypothetical protein
MASSTSTSLPVELAMPTSAAAIANDGVGASSVGDGHPWGPRPKRKDQRKADRLAAELESLGEDPVVQSTSTSTPSTTSNDNSTKKIVTTSRGPNKSSRRKEKKFLQQKAAQAAAEAAAAGIIAEVTITGGPINVAPATVVVAATSTTSSQLSSLVGTTTTTTTTDAKGIAHTVITSTVDDDDDGEGDDNTSNDTATPTHNNGSNGIYPLIRNKLPKSKADRRTDSDHLLLTERFSSLEQKAAFEARVVEQGPAVSTVIHATIPYHTTIFSLH